MTNYPVFPKFKKVTMADKKMHDEFFKHFAPYSDFSFNDLMVWMNYSDDLYASFDHNNLVVSFSNPLDSNKLAFSVLGNNRCGDTIKKIFALQESQGQVAMVSMVPEVTVSSLGHQRRLIVIEEDQDNRDYIFDVTKLHELKGGEFAKLRYKINHFLKHQSEVDARTLDLSSTATKQLLLSGMDDWLGKMSSGGYDRQFEVEMVKRQLQFANDLSPLCLGIFKRGRLISFSIFHFPPQDGFAIGNHIKYDPEYRYLFDFTFWTTINWMYDHGVKYVNGEQDLGIEGMRTHKQEMRPCGYLRRYKLTAIPDVLPLSTPDRALTYSL